MGDPVWRDSADAKRLTPWDLREWAEERHLKFYIVDNCWVRVPLSRDQLNELFASRIDDKVSFPAIGGDMTYVIQAEEF